MEEVYIDRYSAGHAALGVCMGIWQAPWWVSLGLAVGWELVENRLKVVAPEIFPQPTPDSFGQADVDVAFWMGGYSLVRAFDKGPVPAVWRSE